MLKQPQIAIIGLGYVGLPLAVSLAKHYPTVGYDISEERIAELKQGFDRTCEISAEALEVTTLDISVEDSCLAAANIYIVTVATPVDNHNQPDLSVVEAASKTVGQYLKSGDIVVYESTVYPGVTEDFCGKILSDVSGFEVGKDFFLGYSPERINPGDKEHTVENITKVVAGQTDYVTNLLAEIYNKVTNNNTFKAKCIKTAETAKVIENTQRDINIAFINEVTKIVNKLDVSVHDVLEAANTKWNFLDFKPGLVGGHCIGVDPYYLAHVASALGHEPNVILSGRKINESMGLFIADCLQNKIHHRLNKFKAKILVLGLTFKENIPDLRNSKVIDVIRSLEVAGHQVDVVDPFANAKDAKLYYEVDIFPAISDAAKVGDYDATILAVPHKVFIETTEDEYCGVLNKPGIIYDIKGVLKDKVWPDDIEYYTL